MDNKYSDLYEETLSSDLKFHGRVFDTIVKKVKLADDIQATIVCGKQGVKENKQVVASINTQKVEERYKEIMKDIVIAKAYLLYTLQKSILR